ncbi:MAG: DoxX family protein, partial [Flavobacteriales bacterium]|nr:DoxX family protein [Flavobacteriales bacterium]
GIDKVVDWRGNLSWLKGHFEGSPFANAVPLLLAIVTATEIGAGAACAYGVVEMIFMDQSTFAVLGMLLSALNIVLLFAGQRIAKDYPGAAVLAGYFLLAIVLLQFIA